MGEKGKGKRRRSDDARRNSTPEPNHNDAHEVRHDCDDMAETWSLLARTYLKLDHAVAARLACWDLTPTQFDVLAQLGSAPGISQQELADRLLVTKGNVSQLLARLEGRGLIRREREGRVLRLSLTDDGRQLHEQVAPVYQSWIPEPFTALKHNQLRRLQKALRILDQHLEADAGTDAARMR